METRFPGQKHVVLAALFFAAMVLAVPDAVGATRTDEGFATRSTKGRVRSGINRGKAGDDVLYFIKWDDANPRWKVRCVVRKNNSSGEILFEDAGEIDPEDGYTTCGMETDTEDAGTYWFEQYIDGEKAGERAIVLEESSWWGSLGKYRKFKYALGALAGVILGFFWLRKKLKGGDGGDEGSIGGTAGAKSPRAGVVIGSALQAPLPSMAAAPAPSPKPSGEAAYEAFKKRLALDKTARVVKVEDVLPIAKAARAAGDPNTAVAAVRAFDKAFPGDALIPDVFLFTARLLLEDLKNPDMARKILEHVVARYPGHYLAQDARRLLKDMAAA